MNAWRAVSRLVASSTAQPLAQRATPRKTHPAPTDGRHKERRAFSRDSMSEDPVSTEDPVSSLGEAFNQGSAIRNRPRRPRARARAARPRRPPAPAPRPPTHRPRDHRIGATLGAPESETVASVHGAPMYIDDFKQQLPDIDEVETREWIDSLDQVLDQAGENRARFLMFKLLKRARQRQIGVPALTQTRYINTISPEQEPYFPGNEELERRIRRLIRWNAVAMVLRANVRFPGIGGHMSTYASAASLYEVGFNHFFRGKEHPGGGDQVFFQGHAAPGIYARAFLEGRLSGEDLDRYRRETGGRGLSSYPHPRLMPDFWEFPTVSMGLGPLAAVYQARFNRYLHNRGITDTSQQRVWAYLGDGEMDEPESISGISLAAREGLDNLTFVVNCNLQRLDGPVRGNGKVIQELEGLFRGAGWNVIKVIWGREWDELLARDADGALVEKMNTTVDGEFQKYSTSTGLYVREHFFGPIHGSASSSSTSPTGTSSASGAAATTTTRSTPPTRPRPSTRARRR